MFEFIKRKDFRKVLANWVRENLGDEYVPEALDNYEKMARGIPMGGFLETMIMLDIIEHAKSGKNLEPEDIEDTANKSVELWKEYLENK